MVDLLVRERDLGEKIVIADLVIRVFAVERDGTFIGKEDFPAVGLDIVKTGARWIMSGFYHLE